jgi:hypothetical protein
MIVDHWRRHDDRHRPPAPTDPDIAASKRLSRSDGLAVSPPDGDPQPTEE